MKAAEYIDKVKADRAALRLENAKLREALEEIIICVWADNFKNADTKLDVIDKRAEQALASEYSTESEK